MFNIIDMTVLKNFADDEFAVGAVGACGTLITLITGIMVGCAAGANVTIARHIGAGDKERVRGAVGTAVCFATVGGIIVSILGLCCADLFLGWMNCPEVLHEKAALYFRLYFAGVPISLIYNVCAGVLRSTGDSKRPMLFLNFAGILKVLFTILFVAVFKMSVVGVALATIISWGTSCFLGLRALLKSNHPLVRLEISKIRFYKTELKNVLHVGVPDGLQRALYSFANVIIATTVNSFGPEATTGISIANNFDGILYNIVTAPALAVMPYVSQNFGANNLKRAKQSVLRGMMIATALGASFGALSAIFSGNLASIMSSDPVVIGYARQKMMIISSTYFICGINDILCSALRGLKKPLIPTISALIFMCGIRFIWVYLVFPLYENLTFLYLIWPIGWILSIITLSLIYIPTVKKLQRSNELEITENVLL
ncbi:MAG: MATE family efflux transporter [Clostridia bacterium]|nr:MATE family efflux transporter [Clostridia bacterium]